MPIFVYECTKCEYTFDSLEKKADAKVECPQCKDSTSVEPRPFKQTANPSFKGGGWYKDGYKSTKNKKGAK